ncbi:phospholipid/cholesterol/gamma-HCH transport system permease protein [Desulfacinum hydrothermale DSM 13146]|uniref:Phospholipid/cholesterol/gamma-HCH transport system permease protein n=2 Tax=Desulfacinum hydrothermale TaxID=109258 RepID=A0A1W1XNW2_9BACT|nr:phospholipid/cholesterol/gamma-HCH transport system permease protein [Desulfacinum hydrothermale DSM 13146]
MRCTPSAPFVLSTSRRYHEAFTRLVATPGLRTIVLEMAPVSTVDSAGAAVLKTWQKECGARGINLELSQAAPQVEAFLRFAGFFEKPTARPAPSKKRSPLPERLGVAAVRLWNDTRDLIQFIGGVTVAVGPCCFNPKRFRPREILYYIQQSGPEAVPIVFLVSFLMGLIMAFQAAVQLRQFGANIFVADLVSLALTRELGPLMTAIILAGRSAAAFAAEIGTMKVNEEVDALTVMGFEITEFLVMPKVVALAVSGPLLTVFANASGILGGIVVGVLSLDLTPASFILEVWQILTVGDVAGGLVKSLAFAVVVALVGCFRGLQTERTADSVGRMTTSAVVTSIFLIILTDAVFTIIFHVFSW